MIPRPVALTRHGVAPGDAPRYTVWPPSTLDGTKWELQLMPRIRHWKELNLCRPPGEHRYLHIDSLFNTQAEWHLIETMLPDMLRVALSIKAGTIRPSTILRRLATYSRKNKLYFAFRELGRVVRTIFLPQYISDLELGLQQIRAVGVLRRRGRDHRERAR